MLDGEHKDNSEVNGFILIETDDAYLAFGHRKRRLIKENIL